MKSLHMAAFVLVVVGAINWGLVGLMNLNLVEAILGMGTLTKLVYVLVGLAGVYKLVTHTQNCKECSVPSKRR